jgi:hypothetical protein
VVYGKSLAVVVGRAYVGIPPEEILDCNIVLASDVVAIIVPMPALALVY